MHTDKIRDFFKGVELFSTLSDDELSLLLDEVEVRTLNTGDLLIRENHPRKAIHFIYDGKVALFKTTPYGEEKKMGLFTNFDFLGEGALFDDSPHSTSAKAEVDTTVLSIRKEKLFHLFENNGILATKIFSLIAGVISRRLQQTNSRAVNSSAQYKSGQTRMEHDLLGDRKVPFEAYYGIQTMRAMENFNISGVTLNFFPDLIIGHAIVKMAAAKANAELGYLDEKIHNAIVEACQEIIEGKLHDQFGVDMIQGGAGTSTNMNTNEVIANRALEIMGHKRGQYQYCHPNNHVNYSQSTNDAYPTAVHLALNFANKKLLDVLRNLVSAFAEKSLEFADIIKMGRTQLQDAVPMTLGQTFQTYSDTLETEAKKLVYAADHFLEVNMGATAIGTGINSDPEYSDKVVKHLREITGLDVVLATNLVEATQDTGSFVMYSATMKRLAIKLSKICNDLRLLSSGPRAGFNEINLPKMQPGSSIMPGKVNPVIPEVVNQIAFKVIGNDLTVSLAAESGQLELNVMEPVIAQSIFESIEMLKNGMKTLQYRCIEGITANKEVCRRQVENSIGLVTALNPILGYDTCTMLAKEALEKNASIYDLVLEKDLMTKEELEDALLPENMTKPKKRVFREWK
ncbi:aspartate ammonia-lyase [Candidatus Sulfurimonas marisnigri]|uniref:Aspartate ammonia-lyase n=2 Tax=Candidatus Sulfurimonas marisnigri TaxID=2740405 RepID=A0A7S7M1X1_9BACT|nr:aspartate ammonia-lyase [Candidatus Sulfurimonas marisnigri]